MIGTAISRNGIAVRLTEERWFHIVETHDDIAGVAFTVLDAIQNPDVIIHGLSGELLAIKRQDHKESGKDGFVITAFFTTGIDRLKKRGIMTGKWMCFILALKGPRGRTTAN